MAISSAFGAEGMVLIDMASRVRQNFRLFTLDTEFLFPETYNLMDQVEQRYGITIERVYPCSIRRRNRSGFMVRHCGNVIRSMLQSAEGSAAAAQAGRTAGVDHQHPARSNRGPRGRRQNRVGRKIRSGKDQSHRRLDFKQVWQYIREHDVPYNRCTIVIIPASVARIARAPCGREKIQGRALVGIVERPSADCT